MAEDSDFGFCDYILPTSKDGRIFSISSKLTKKGERG
jgi:hypothetical protein